MFSQPPTFDSLQFFAFQILLFTVFLVWVVNHLLTALRDLEAEFKKGIPTVSLKALAILVAVIGLFFFISNRHTSVPPASLSTPSPSETSPAERATPPRPIPKSDASARVIEL